MAVEVEKLLVTLEARMGRYEREMNRAGALTNTRLAAMEARFATFATRLRSSASTAALGVGTALGGLGAYLGVRQIKQYADSWTSVTRALEASEEIFGIRLRSAEELNKLANDARQDNDSFAKLYIRTAAAVRELGTSEEDVAKATSTVAMALKLGSASASEQTSTMLQLSQALQKGKLDGDEFRTVMENAGVVQELLADKLKVSKGEIVKMAAEGRLKVPQLIGALVDGAEKVERIFKGMPSTIDEALIVLNNQVEEYIGHLNEAYGGTQLMVDALAALAGNVENVGDGALVLASALAAAFAPRLLLGIGAAALGLGAAAGSLGLVLGAAAGGAVAIELFGDRIATSADGVVTLRDEFHALIQLIREDMTAAAKDLDAATQEGTEAAVNRMAERARDGANLIINIFKVFGKLVSATVVSLFDNVADLGYSAIDKIREYMQSLLDWGYDQVNNLIGLYNSIPLLGDAEYLVAPGLTKIENAFAGSGERAKQRFQDAVKGIGDDNLAWLDSVNKRARELALGRGFASSTTVDRGIEAKPVYQDNSPDAAAAKAQKRFDRTLEQLRSGIEMRKLEAQTIGMSAFETEKLLTRQDLLNRAREAGVALSGDDLIAIEALAEANARAVTEAQHLRDAYEEIKNVSADMMKGFINDLREGTSASEALGNALNKIADRLIDMAVNDLVETALGGLTGKGGNPTGPGMGQGILSLFGFADGGIAKNGRPVPLKRFANGGISNTAAIFGEAGPEAAIPLKGGMVPVDLRIPNSAKAAVAPAVARQMSVVVAPVFNVANGDPNTMKTLKGEIAREIPRMVRTEVGQMMDRDGRFSGLRR